MNKSVEKSRRVPRSRRMTDGGESSTAGFPCRRCGECCRIRGFVRVTGAELDRISVHLGMPPRDVIERYTRHAHDRRGIELKERENGECVFLRGDDCDIQPVKPLQCRTFPLGWRYPGVEHVCPTYQDS